MTIKMAKFLFKKCLLEWCYYLQDASMKIISIYSLKFIKMQYLCRFQGILILFPPVRGSNKPINDQKFNF